jgi:hypothetical protein
VPRLPHLEQAFPLLAAAGYEKTSEHTGQPPKDGAYNCIAWAAHDSKRWWWPNSYNYWIPWIQREEQISCFVKTFRWLGYRECSNSRLEFGFEKVALYAMHNSGSPMLPPTDQRDLKNWIPKHMARQLRDGTWTSKAGASEDIRHFTLDAVESYGRYWDAQTRTWQHIGYGCAVLFMRRLVPISWFIRLIQVAQWNVVGRWIT